MTARVRNKDGTFIKTDDPIKDAELRREEAMKLHGYKFKSVDDYLEEVNHQLEKYGFKKQNEKVDKWGFTEDFYSFLGRPRDYQHPISPKIADKINDMRKDSATAPFYTPVDDMYGTPGGYDTWYDSGRVPVSHLMALCSKRVGCFYRICNGVAHDTMDNRFDIVKYSDLDTPINTPEITEMLGWMRRTQFNKNMVEIVDYGERTGLGIVVVQKYLRENQSYKNWSKKAPNTKPESFMSFSSYYMTPTNIYQDDVLDYDKNQWKFIGGIHNPSTIHESRKYVLEMRREELALRGLAIPETCWVAAMCYLNIQYYILKSLSQLGVLTVGVNVDQEYPTPTTVSHYLASLNLMRANNFYVLGKGAELKVMNIAAQLSGINDFMEFLKEDISSASIVPKNQLWGRSEGGGISGAGAIVTKEDYLGSNISTKQLLLTDIIMYILQEVCHFTGLEDKTIKFNIDLLKTKEQRLKEEMMEEQLGQQKVITKQTELGFKLYKKQVKLQMEMSEVQLKMLKQDPEALLQRSDKDEENLNEKEAKTGEAKGDFREDFNYLRGQYTVLENEYKQNQKLMGWLNRNTQDLKQIYNQNDFAWRKQIHGN